MTLVKMLTILMVAGRVRGGCGHSGYISCHTRGASDNVILFSKILLSTGAGADRLLYIICYVVCSAARAAPRDMLYTVYICCLVSTFYVKNEINSISV